MKITVACIAFLLFSNAHSKAQKNDTICFINGDRLTGELKKAEYGLVFLTTEALEKVTVEYDQIRTAFSKKYFEFRMIDGQRHYGSVSKSKVSGNIIITTANDSLNVRIEDIVTIASIKNKFIQKIDGTLDLGLSYTKASNVLQYYIDGMVTHRSNNVATRFDFSTMVTKSGSEDETSSNNDINLNVTRYLPNKWFTVATITGQQNTELDLAYRLQGGLGGGYDIVRTSGQRLYGMSELLFNYEQTIDSSYLSKNGELMLSLQYKWYKYRVPKVDFTAGFSYYPNLTVDRTRLQFDLNAKFEIVKDLYFSLTFYETYDSKNISTSAAKNDFGITNTISFIF